MSKRTEVVLSRQELYDLVWSKPMRTLAKEFGMSDVALAKWCRKMDIPKPGVGYWQKLEAGKRVKRPKLPNPEAEDTLHIRLPDPDAAPTGSSSDPREVPEYEAFETNPENRIAVSEPLSRPHSLVTKSQAALKRGHTDRRYGWVYATDPSLDIRVSAECLPRALRIFDALLKALETRGIKVEVSGERHAKVTTFALLDGERIGFGMFESPQKGIRTDHWSGKPVEGMVPSGRLVLRIRSEYGSDQHQFRDQKRRSVEDRLNDFVIALRREAEHRKAWRIQREEQRLEWERERQRQEELEQLRLLEQAKAEALYRDISNWRLAQDIRAFLSAAESAGVSAVQNIKFESWADWARKHAEQIDPLSSSASEQRPWNRQIKPVVRSSPW